MPPLERPWPDSVDTLGLALIALLAVGGPLLGYVLLYLDYRAYLRSLRRALVLVRGYAEQLPYWVLRDRPPCLQALGLSGRCTRADVLAAYRERVKHLHPDAGGSRQEFARLQRHFEEAMQLVEAWEAEC